MKPHHSKEGHATRLENNPDNNKILNRINNEMIKEALERAELKANESIINHGMAKKIDDLQDPPIANNLVLHSPADDSDDDDNESSQNDLPINIAYNTSIKAVQDVVKDVNVLH
uniref:Uncharacterized protein n=1 Tax=Amphimedon queenslandica TaxID=400682 RepID=A0A1X7UDF5_AMPQE